MRGWPPLLFSCLSAAAAIYPLLFAPFFVPLIVEADAPRMMRSSTTHIVRRRSRTGAALPRGRYPWRRSPSWPWPPPPWQRP